MERNTNGSLESTRADEEFATVVIGGGQAGLSVGYHLARKGQRFVILDAEHRIGDQWRRRWDSLRLFTPARFSHLDGMPFPSHPDYFPTKDEFADYLESYAERFELPVRHSSRVERVWREGDSFRIRAGDSVLAAQNVVVAMSNYQRPRLPGFSAELAGEIVQLHSSEYLTPQQVPDGGSVLVVGAGNSGSEVAIELAKDHRVYLAGRYPGHLPFDVAGYAGRRFLVRLVVRVIFHRLLTVRTPIGRKLRPKLTSRSGPLIRTKAKHLAAAGVERLPRVAGVSNGRPQLADGRTLDVSAVIWCTGYRPGFEWLDLVASNTTDHEPLHQRGIVPQVPGLYFVGLHFLDALSSAMIHGVGRDAERIVRLIGQRRLAPTGAPPPQATATTAARP